MGFLIRDGVPTKTTWAIALTIWTCVIAFWVGVICVGIHFIHKYW